MKYEDMKEASFPKVVPSNYSIVKVIATDNSVAENFNVLTSALEQSHDIIKEESAERTIRRHKI